MKVQHTNDETRLSNMNLHLLVEEVCATDGEYAVGTRLGELLRVHWGREYI
jgi:hypothetical protein